MGFGGFNLNPSSKTKLSLPEVEARVSKNKLLIRILYLYDNEKLPGRFTRPIGQSSFQNSTHISSTPSQPKQGVQRLCQELEDIGPDLAQQQTIADNIVFQRS
ncbi:hypothetical protein VNO80_24662 [Phaseolus coccineus]|uniref:Uncharacterized protein n=1 Tax=Phaseolus coccineus TaxID=3886 RepID=A0AAN9LSU0_PHACN